MGKCEYDFGSASLVVERGIRVMGTKASLITRSGASCQTLMYNFLPVST
jgi:hypothetical protein